MQQVLQGEDASAQESEKEGKGINNDLLFMYEGARESFEALPADTQAFIKALFAAKVDEEIGGLERPEMETEAAAWINDNTDYILK